MILLLALAFLLLPIPALAQNASMYGDYDPSVGHPYFGRRTACGNIHVPGNTAAHKILPCGTKVRITNKANGKSGIVVVSDRGPFVKGREWDLNSAFGRAIGCPGICNVKAEILR